MVEVSASLHDSAVMRGSRMPVRDTPPSKMLHGNLYFNSDFFQRSLRHYSLLMSFYVCLSLSLVSDLIHCTNEPNVSIPQLANLLIERSQNTNWTVVFKALITVHHMMCYGNEVKLTFTFPIVKCDTHTHTHVRTYAE